MIVILPLVLVVVIPAVYLAAIALVPVEPGAGVPQGIASLLPERITALPYKQALYYAFTVLLCPMLFLAVPIICSVASASCVFVSEKENGTLETLLLSSMDPKLIYNSKTSGCILLSLVVSVISFIAFAITAGVGDILLSVPFFFNFEWLVLIFLLTPAVSFFGVSFVSCNINRVYSTGESLQTMGYLILPFILLFLMQFSGLFYLNALLLLILAILIAVAAVILFNFSARRFHAEWLLSELRGNAQ